MRKKVEEGGAMAPTVQPYLRIFFDKCKTFPNSKFIELKPDKSDKWQRWVIGRDHDISYIRLCEDDISGYHARIEYHP